MELIRKIFINASKLAGLYATFKRQFITKGASEVESYIIKISSNKTIVDLAENSIDFAFILNHIDENISSLISDLIKPNSVVVYKEGVLDTSYFVEKDTALLGFDDKDELLIILKALGMMCHLLPINKEIILNEIKSVIQSDNVEKYLKAFRRGKYR